MPKNRRVVSLSSGATALAEPQFVIELDGKLYQTVAVVEYDPDHPRISPAQKKAILAARDKTRKLAGLKAAASGLAPHIPGVPTPPSAPPPPGGGMGASYAVQVAGALDCAQTDPP